MPSRLLLLHLAHFSCSLPPQYYGGTERVVWYLIRYQSQLVKCLKRYLGSKNVVVGVIGLLNRKYLKFLPSNMLKLDVRELVGKLHGKLRDHMYMIRVCTSIANYLHEFDTCIIHNHILQRNSWLWLTYLALLKNRIICLTTLHYDPPMSRNLIVFDNVTYSFNIKFVAISRSQFNRLKSTFRRSLVAYVYNGIPVEDYPFCSQKEDYFVYLGAILPSKGPHIAVKLARKLGIKLILAGPIRDKYYFNQKIKPYLNSNIVYVGEVDEHTKLKLLAKAKALLFPVLREEFFGLNVIEALACGTPVITFARGAMPEIVAHGKTGFLVRSIEEFYKAIKAIDNIEPLQCRKLVESKFNARLMTLRYLAVYKKCVESIKGTT